jgi:hypothetical protein
MRLYPVITPSQAGSRSSEPEFEDNGLAEGLREAVRFREIDIFMLTGPKEAIRL